MATIRLVLAYDGTGFRGWATQRDPEIRTIEGELTAVLTDVLEEPVKLRVAGRTDAGVHARGQVASFRSERGLASRTLRTAINGRLAPEVVCLRADEVQASFDARLAASAREYRYRIDTGEVPDPFTARFVWHRPGPLDVTRMRSAARELVGEHDFTSFCRHPGPGRATVRDLQQLTVTSTGECVELGFRANAFLHQMVRALTGTLVLVGGGKLGPDDVARLLANRSRVGTGNLAPANGLTLERVAYGRRTHP
ncbi:MAG: tRNA pseudouridine(38-40) synthase TruA [Actinomycetota bacterium]